MKKHVLATGFCIAIVIAIAWLARGIPRHAVLTQELVVGDAKRTYRLVVPERLAQPAAIVFAFHGAGETPTSMAFYSELDRLAAADGLVVVYPASAGQTWLIDADPAMNSDLQFFDLLKEELARRFDVTANRVALIGMSDGGSFAQLVAAERSAQVAAVVSHSGVKRTTKSPDRRIPIMLVVGQEDRLLANMQSDAAQYQTEGHPTELIEVPKLDHTWATNRNPQIWEFLKRCLNNPAS